jgi:hypothetical protein
MNRIHCRKKEHRAPAENGLETSGTRKKKEKEAKKRDSAGTETGQRDLKPWGDQRPTTKAKGKEISELGKRTPP